MGKVRWSQSYYVLSNREHKYIHIPFMYLCGCTGMQGVLGCRVYWDAGCTGMQGVLGCRAYWDAGCTGMQGGQ